MSDIFGMILALNAQEAAERVRRANADGSNAYAELTKMINPPPEAMRNRQDLEAAADAQWRQQNTKVEFDPETGEQTTTLPENQAGIISFGRPRGVMPDKKGFLVNLPGTEDPNLPATPQAAQDARNKTLLDILGKSPAYQKASEKIYENTMSPQKPTSGSPMIRVLSGQDPLFKQGSPFRQENHDGKSSYDIRFDPETNKPVANLGRSAQENRYPAYAPAPNLPPGWNINRITGEYIPPKPSKAPGGAPLSDISLQWQAVKKSVQVANDQKSRNMQAAGSTLFEGTKGPDGKTIIPSTFGHLKSLRNSLPDGVFGEMSNKVQLFNSWDQFIDWQTSDKNMAQLKSTIVAAAERMGNIYSGGGSVTSDQKIKLAQDLLKASLSKEAFSGVIDAHAQDLMNIVNGYGTVWTTTPGQGPKFTPATAPGAEKKPGKSKFTILKVQ